MDGQSRFLVVGSDYLAAFSIPNTEEGTFVVTHIDWYLAAQSSSKLFRSIG